MPNFIEKLFKPEKRETSDEDFVEIETYEYKEVSEEKPASMYVKVAELVSLNDINEVKKHVYEGNIVIVNIGPMGTDRLVRERVIKELKKVVDDIEGDIVGLGETQLILTPSGVKVDRNKITSVRA
jgi:hypothetical protein